MRVKLLSLGLMLTLAATTLGYDFRLKNQDKLGLGVSSVERVMRLDERQIDLATAALLISRDWEYNINFRRVRDEIDEMAYIIMENATKGTGRPRDYQIIKEINRYLFEEMGFTAVKDANNPEDLFLHSVMSRRSGYCLSLSVLYLSIGERIGLPLHGVVVPGHFFVRYDDGTTQFNIETTSNGNTATDEHYITNFNVPTSNNGSIYMKNLTKLQTLGCFFNNLGNCYMNIDDLDSAKKYLEYSADLASSLAEANNNLGNLYYRQEKFSNALSYFRRALNANPYDNRAYHNIGNVYIAQDKVLQAIGQFEKSIDIDPNYIDSYIALAKAYRKKEFYNAALNILDRGIDRKASNKWWKQYGLVFRDMKEYDFALDYFQRALDQEENTAEIYFEIGYTYSQMEKDEQAIEAYQDALRLDDKLVAAMQNLGNIYLAQKEYEKALELFENALNIEPNDANLNFALGLAYAQTDQVELAEQYYLKTVRINRKHKTAYYNLAVLYYNDKDYTSALEYALKAKQYGFELPKGLETELLKKSKK